MKQIGILMVLLALAVSLAAPAATPAKTPLGASTSLKDLDKKQGDKYPTVAMHESKRGADKASGVVYLDSSQREERRILIRHGLVYDHTGKPLLDTKSAHGNQNNYVMDAAGNFYLFDEFTTHNIRHSSIFAGGPVAGAGNIQIKDGRIVYIDSNSGHYPSKELFGNVLKELAACGVNTDGLTR